MKEIEEFKAARQRLVAVLDDKRRELAELEAELGLHRNGLVPIRKGSGRNDNIGLRKSILEAMPPYPKTITVAELADFLGLKKTQVGNCLTNARRKGFVEHALPGRWRLSVSAQ
jgi:hypothetical protein